MTRAIVLYKRQLLVQPLKGTICGLMSRLCKYKMNKMTSLTSLHATRGRKKANRKERGKEWSLRKEKIGERIREGGWGGKRSRRQRKRRSRKWDWGCWRLGMPGKRSTASSALLHDKLRETRAWINPPLSLFTETSSFSSPDLQMMKGWRGEKELSAGVMWVIFLHWFI